MPEPGSCCISLLTPPGWPGRLAGGRRRDGGERGRIVLDLAGIGTAGVSGGSGVDLEIEAFEQLSATRDPAVNLITSWRIEPVALADPGVPAADLFEILLDLLGLRERVVLAERLELDLPDELGVALLHDLGGLLGAELLEAGDQRGLLVRREAGHFDQVARTVEPGDPISDAGHRRPQVRPTRDHADALLEVVGADPLQVTPDSHAVAGRLRRHPVH